MRKPKVNSCFVGIDVSKDKMDIYVRPTGESWTQPSGDYKALCKKLRKLNPTLIVLEPTGGHELGVLNALIDKGFRVSREHAYKIHHHAKGSGQLAKTDSLDASMIAHYAECYSEKIEPMVNNTIEQELIKQLVSRRHQLVVMRASEKNRLSRPGISEVIKTSSKRIIRMLSKEIEGVDKRICEITRSDEEWTKRKKILQSVSGVGERVSTVLLSNLPELGRINRKQIAALVGVAPYKRESGKYKGQQRIQGGRSEVRAALYLAVLSAKKHNPPIRGFYERLVKKGKKKMVALIACMHKLLRILNAMISKQQLFNPSLS